MCRGLHGRYTLWSITAQRNLPSSTSARVRGFCPHEKRLVDPPFLGPCVMFVLRASLTWALTRGWDVQVIRGISLFRAAGDVRGAGGGSVG